VRFTTPHRGKFITFNSPWECRIGLTSHAAMDGFTAPRDFQFPVGMSNRSYFGNDVQATIFKFNLSIPRGNVE